MITHITKRRRKKTHNKMSANTLLASEFDADNLVISKMQQNDSGMGTVRVRYQYTPGEEPERLVVQTARMRCPFGISNNEKYSKEGDNLKWSIQISFDGEEKSRKIQKFRGFLEAFDDFFVKKGMENADEWINDDDPDEKSIKKAYKGALKRFKPKKDKPGVVYSDTFRVNIPWNYEVNSPRSNVEFFDEAGNETSWTEVTPGCEVIALFAINGIWCSPGISSYGPSIKLVQIQVFKPKKIKGFNIKFDKDSDDESSDDDELEEEDEIEDDDDQ